MSDEEIIIVKPKKKYNYYQKKEKVVLTEDQMREKKELYLKEYYIKNKDKIKVNVKNQRYYEKKKFEFLMLKFKEAIQLTGNGDALASGTSGSDVNHIYITDKKHTYLYENGEIYLFEKNADGEVKKILITEEVIRNGFIVSD